MKAGGELAKHREEAAREAVLFSQNFLKEKGSILGIQQVLITEDEGSGDVKIRASFQNSGLGSVEIFDLVLKTLVRFLGGPHGELFKELNEDPYVSEFFEDFTGKAFMAALSASAKNKELMSAEEVEDLIDSDEDD